LITAGTFADPHHAQADPARQVWPAKGTISDEKVPKFQKLAARPSKFCFALRAAKGRDFWRKFFSTSVGDPRGPRDPVCGGRSNVGPSRNAKQASFYTSLQKIKSAATLDMQGVRKVVPRVSI